MIRREIAMYSRRGAAWLSKALAAERCFYLIVILFGVQAVWFAFTARYPMAFDENFHFGLIQLHAQQWLPFFTSQPLHAEQFGAVVRDPSNPIMTQPLMRKNGLPISAANV